MEQDPCPVAEKDLEKLWIHPIKPFTGIAPQEERPGLPFPHGELVAYRQQEQNQTREKDLWLQYVGFQIAEKRSEIVEKEQNHYQEDKAGWPCYGNCSDQEKESQNIP